MTIEQCNDLVRQHGGHDLLWVPTGRMSYLRFKLSILNPPPVLWYQEFFLGTTSHGRCVLEYCQSGVLDGQFTTEGLDYIKDWR